MEIEVTIPGGLATIKSAAWGAKQQERYRQSQEEFRYAIQNWDKRDQLKEWLESRTKLSLSVEFHLSKQRAAQSDIDSLLPELFNPLVEGACGPRPPKKPVPQTKDALFWHVTASKIAAEEEKTVIRIKPL